MSKSFDKKYKICKYSCDLAMKPLNIITSFDAKVKRAQSNEHKADRGAMISDFTLILQIQKLKNSLMMLPPKILM